MGKDLSQESLDLAMIETDGTEFKSKLGANAILGVSLAFAVAQAQSQGQQVYEYIAAVSGNKQVSMPRPMLNIMNGGAHADWATDIQEYMILPMGNLPYAEKLRKSVEVFHHLGKLLKSKGYSTNVGNEGGYAPAITSNAEAFDLILEAIGKAGYEIGEAKTSCLVLTLPRLSFYQDGAVSP